MALKKRDRKTSRSRSGYFAGIVTRAVILGIILVTVPDLAVEYVQQKITENPVLCAGNIINQLNIKKHESTRRKGICTQQSKDHL